MDKYENVKAVVEGLDDNDLLTMWNEYQNANCYDGQIYPIDMLDELLDGMSPLDILQKCEDVNPRDEYFRETIYGFESFDHPSDYIDIDDLVDWIVDNEKTFDNWELEEIFDDDDDSDDEEDSDDE